MIPVYPNPVSAQIPSTIPYSRMIFPTSAGWLLQGTDKRSSRQTLSNDTHTDSFQEKTGTEPAPIRKCRALPSIE